MDDLRQLQQPPVQNEAASRTLALLDSRYPNWNALTNSNDFDDWVDKAEEESKRLKSEVCFVFMTKYPK
jgi:hypothetical protein